MLGDCIKVMEQNNILSSSLHPFLPPPRTTKIYFEGQNSCKSFKIIKSDNEMWYVASCSAFSGLHFKVHRKSLQG